MLKELQLEVNDQIRTNLIWNEYWKIHFSELRFYPDVRGGGDEETVGTIDHGEDTTME
jgi:hypothetical protein